MTVLRYLYIILTLSLSLCFSANTYAGDGNTPLYIGIGKSFFTFEDSTSINASGYYLNLGLDLGNYFAIEALSSSSAIDEFDAESYEIDYYHGIFARFNLRYDHFTVYLLAGYGTTSLTYTTTVGGGSTVAVDDSGFSYGIGMDLYGTKNAALTLRAMDYIDEDFHMLGAVMGFHFYFDDIPRIQKRY